MKLTSLPFDLVHEVAGYVDSKPDILRLALSSKHLFLGLCPILYSDVQLVDLEQCYSTLTMLNHRPDIARHVQKLLVRFSTAHSTPSVEHDGYRVSSLVHSLAHSLDALHTFVWDAEEIPRRDDMWFALRLSCPRLTTVGTSYGAQLPDSHSELFQFKGLRGFTLNVKRGFYERFADTDLQELHAEPRLWDMLIRQSLDLEELHVSGAPFISAQAVRPLCHARWPKLHTLSLGDILLDWDPRSGVKPPFITFLEAHPRLRSLRTSRTALNPALLTSLTSGSLPELTHFSGAIEHLQELAPIHHQITSVALDEPLVIRDFAPSLLASVLKGLKSLTELRVCFVFESAYEGGTLVRSIAHACPGLTKLEIICTRKSAFTIDTLAKAVRTLPRLQRLRVTLVRAQHEHSLPICAATIAHTLPRLHAFSITFVSPDFSLPHHFGSDIGRISGDPGHLYTETGHYVVKTDQHGLPTSLACTEQRSSRSLLSFLKSFPVPTISWRKADQKVKRSSYTFDLHPSAKKRRGLGMIFEKSTAGEETRILAVLISLTALALWGFFS
ncbi:hypothetical protein EV363DRAFT_1160578 [Boletus edulis]|nr:hypothetical protein EV363DRAFT_1160578 [Boletus edulis]